VIGGLCCDGHETSDVEVLDFSGDGKRCASLPDYPLSVGDLTATFLNNKILACGGFGPRTERCFELRAEDLTQWVEIPALPLPDQGMGSSNIDGKWLISGGYTANASLTWIFDGEDFSNGPVMPDGKADHCQVSIDNNYVFVTAGTSEATYLLDWRNQEFTILRDMPVRVSSPVCGTTRHYNGATAGDFKVDVLVRGLDRTYFYNLNEKVWILAAPFSEEIDGSSSAQISQGVLSIGGTINGAYTNKIYVFNQPTLEWLLQEEKLNVPRRQAAAVAVPDTFLNCN